jgi:hypothetical protein
LLVSKILAGQKDGLEQISGLTYRMPGSDEIITNRLTELIEDLDDLPIPAYENIMQKNKLRIDAGRGCPYQCTYCSTNDFFSRKFRVKTVGRLLTEMKYCKEKLRVSGAGISHDMFTLRKKYVEEFTESLKEINKTSRMPYSWTCSARTDCVSEEMLDRMKESGCKAIFFGIETGSASMQKQIRKNLDLDEAVKIIRHSTRLGIVTIVSYMAGFPGETRADLTDTLRSILRMLSHGARPQLTLLSILPGTSVYNEFINELEYDGNHSGFSVSYLTEKTREMILADKKMFSSFYFLPNEHIQRETYLFLANLVNNLEHFIPTILLLRDYVEKDYAEADLLALLEKMMPAYRNKKDMVLPELFLLTDILKKYLEFLHYKGLPAYIWDVFQADFTKAFMISEYERWQLFNAGRKRGYAIPGKIGLQGRIHRRTYWKIIESEHYIHDYLQNPVQMISASGFRRGRFQYLILPVSHRMVRIQKIPARLIPVYNSLCDCKVEEFIEKNVVHLDKHRLIILLKRMARQGLIDLEPILQAG